MLDLRKLLLVAVVVCIATTAASAQLVSPVLSCVAQAAGTPSIRSEGLTELVGDVIITCTGGTPTAAGELIPQVNIQIFTEPGINITSRAMASSGTNNRFTEALLFIDEPDPNEQTLCGSTTAPEESGFPGVCSNNTGLWNGVTLPPPSPYVDLPGLDNTNRPNAWQGQRVLVGPSSFQPTTLIWTGIQFDPPGTTRTRTIRITNVRVNANQMGIGNSPQAVKLFISTSASGVGDDPSNIPPPIQLPITNPNPTVAFAQRSLNFTASSTSGLQCFEDERFITLTYTEEFPSAWRRRSAAIAPNSETSPAPIDSDTFLNIFQTETGFYKTYTNSDWSGRGTVGGQPGAGNISNILGLADHGTRLIARFTNVNAGVDVSVERYAPIVNQSGTTTGWLRLLEGVSDSGSGAFDPVTGTGYTEILDAGSSNRNGVAVWEILATDTTQFERVAVGVRYSWSPDLTNGRPALGSSGGNGGYAPISTVGTSSATAPIPRFADATIARNPMLTINTCRSNLLWPFVTNQGGFDTGLAISNTTKDPFGTQIQTGACKINYYGNVGGSKVDGIFHPTPVLTGGEHVVWTLAQGGGSNPVAGFQGYVIAQCDFQYAHGYGFISDVGAQKLAQGYLALVMDDPLEDRGDRTGSVSEVLGH